MAVVAIIPARYGSTRLPGKPLAEIGGKPMIQHVYESASKAKVLDRVLVATDDRRIVEVVKGFGGEVVVTSKDHASGTDRLAEVARRLKADWVVNVQGDLPFIRPGGGVYVNSLDGLDPAVMNRLQELNVGVFTLNADACAKELGSPAVTNLVVLGFAAARGGLGLSVAELQDSVRALGPCPTRPRVRRSRTAQPQSDPQPRAARPAAARTYEERTAQQRF